MPHTVIVLFSIACTMVGTLVGSFLSARLMRENGWLVGLASGTLFYLTVVLVNAGGENLARSWESDIWWDNLRSLWTSGDRVVALDEEPEL